MHDLITVCPSYLMMDINGNPCEKCLGGNFKHCIKGSCVKGSKLMSYLAVREAKVIRKKKWYDDVDLFICPSKFMKGKLEKGNFTNKYIKKTVYSNSGYKNLPLTSPGFNVE